MTKYLAITLGPFDIFRSVRHTREVWGASYLFSYMARRLIEKMCENGNTKANADHFIQPNISDPRLFEPMSGVGLFPDHIIVNAKILNGRNFEDIKKAVVQELGTLVGDKNGFLTAYLRIECIECEVRANENPIHIAATYLDAAELQPRLVSEFVLKKTSNSELQASPLKLFLKHINKKDGFMREHYQAFDVNDTVRFESLVEIATREVWKKDESSKNKYKYLVNKYLWNGDDDVDSDGEFVAALQKDFKDVFKTYHKYVCVVKADGDGIGKRITSLTDVSEIQKLSKSLLNWGLDVKDTIRAYGGVPIYVGGDDLLFFAPVCNNKSTIEPKNIVALLRQIKNNFVESFDEAEGFSPNLSFGLSISYYKFPLSEAIEKADSLLALVKKEDNKAQGNKGGKLAVSLLKHSGSTFDLELKLDDSKPLLAAFDGIYEQMGKEKVADKAFLNGVNYKIRENQTLIERVATDPARLQNVFENIFEQNLKDPKAKDQYLARLQSLIGVSFTNDVYQKQNEIENHVKVGTDMATKEVFSTVRLAKFLRGLEELKD